MELDRNNTEVRSQKHLMDAEGTSDKKPTALAVQILLSKEGWCCSEIDIWFDTMQGFWRWSCEIDYC